VFSLPKDALPEPNRHREHPTPSFEGLESEEPEMNVRAIVCALALALIAAGGAARPAQATLLEGWQLMEVQWLNSEFEPGPEGADANEYGTATYNFVLEAWEPNDPPHNAASGGAAGYITATSASATAGEDGADGDGAAAYGYFYARFEWDDEELPAAEWWLDGVSTHAAECSGVSSGQFASSYAVAWGGVGDRDFPVSAQHCDINSSWDPVNGYVYNHYHPITGPDGDPLNFEEQIGLQDGFVLEGIYPWGGVFVETQAYTDGTMEEAHSFADAVYAVSVQTIEDD
jgi:hypothetical protein